MKLTFIGSGSAFTVGAGNYHSNMLLENEKHSLLIDCGSDARLALHELGLTYKDIHDVYVSHLHADHVGGLEWLALSTYFDKTCSKPTLFINENLVQDLWHKVLEGGLSSIGNNLSAFFNLKSIAKNEDFRWNNLEMRLFQTVHVLSGFALLPSYGLIFTANHCKVVITTDTQFSPHQIRDIYQLADIIFQDCETTAIKSGVHAHYEELVQLDPSIKGKMWLYHYNPGPLPDAKKDGFRGFVKRGQCFDFNNKKTLI